MLHRSSEHPAFGQQHCRGESSQVVPHRWSALEAIQAINFCNLGLQTAHLIRFASIVGQCQDLHGQGLGRHAADQLYEVSGVLQIICTTEY